MIFNCSPSQFKKISEFAVKTQTGDTPTGEFLVTDSLNIKGGYGVGVSVSENTLQIGIDEATFPENLKGKPGEKGDSITISSIVESSEDGGTNIVTFSDGSKLNVKNGSAGSGGGGSSVQANYTQNDSTKSDYIKNRPFYSEDVVPFIWDGDIEDPRVPNQDIPEILAWADAPTDPKQLIGMTLKVIKDGAESEVKVTTCMTRAEVEAFGGEVEGAIVITDIDAPGVSYLVFLGYDNTGFFYVYDAAAAEMPTVGLWHEFVYDRSTSTTTAYISEIRTTVYHKLNSKFMPEGYGYDGDSVGVVETFISAPIIEEVGFFGFRECSPPEIGAMYRVSIVGGTKSVDQECILYGVEDGVTQVAIGFGMNTQSSPIGLGIVFVQGEPVTLLLGVDCAFLIQPTDEALFRSSFGFADDYVLTGAEIVTVEKLGLGTIPSKTRFIPAQSKTVMLSATGWTGDITPYSQNVAINGIRPNTVGMVGIADSATDEQYVAATNAQLRKAGQGHNSITIKCYGTRPLIDIPVTVSGIWDV